MAILYYHTTQNITERVRRAPSTSKENLSGETLKELGAVGKKKREMNLPISLPNHIKLSNISRLIEFEIAGHTFPG